MKKPSEYIELLRSLGKEWKWLLRYVSKYRLQIAFYILIGLFSIAMGLGSTVASKYLIDSVVSHNSDTIFKSAVIAITFGLTQRIVSAVFSRLAGVVGSKINMEIRYGVYEHITYSKWESIRTYHSGELLNRIEGDVSLVSSSIISFIPNAFTTFAQFIGYLAVILYYDPTMAIFAFMSAPFLVFSSKITTKMVRKYNKERREMNGKILSFYSESIQNLQTIKAFDITKRYVDQMKTNLELHRKIVLEHDRFTIIMSLCMSLIGLAVAYTCYGWGIYRLWQGAISYGTMTLFLQISGQLTSSFSSIVSLIPSAISIATSAGRIMEITALPLEKNDDAEKAEKMEKSANESGVTIVCNNLKYTYPDGDDPVVASASFRAEAGETIAFVGPSGEGKTTLLRLVLGLVESDSGELTVETKDGRKIPVSECTRRFCSYVPQGNAIFSGTVADNLRIVRPEATDDEIVNALETADAWSFIKELPLGINTEIGEKGVNFSEGQVQRMSIARALLRDAPIIVMDEATSALDEKTEEKVLANMMKEFPNRTRIITTHRPSMLKYCTRIYRINENGELTEVENNS